MEDPLGTIGFRPPPCTASESVAHIAEALWMQALEEGKRRALLEQRDSARLAELDQQRLEVRSHVLTLREGEIDSRLRDRDRTIEELNLRLRELSGALHKEQASRELLVRQIAELRTGSKNVRRGRRAAKSRTGTRQAKSPKRVKSKIPRYRRRR